MASRAAHPHGTWERYNAGCRCTGCRAAHLERWTDDYERRAGASPEEIPHGIGGYGNWGCRCEVCCAAKEAENAAQFRNSNAASLPGAKKRGQEWTGPELEIAARKELTAKQVAEMLGRTVSGVRNVRTRLNKEPELRRLAGLASEPTS
jgi:hypothetical protein